MDNYKIKVNDEAESKEAQELFLELGGQWKDSGKVILEYDPSMPFFYLDGEILHKGSSTHNYQVCDRKELTLPQLQDLVVLKRGDVKDATHKNFRTNTPYLKQGENEYYMFNGEWVLSNCPNDLEPINKPQDPALISGAEALDALKAKKEVEYCGEGLNDSWLSAETLPVVYFLTDSFRFRLKPQTIKLELELPKPFEPKDGETYWHIYPSAEKGYHFVRSFEDDDVWCQFGAWRTEAEVKQVVEQLRKIRGTNS
ncbi:hypothetical protein KSB25_11230 [Acinetobacter baumannii]|nr:hypothetical protein [Acinetobacter baumannii]MCE6556635.1 hypothetical protein [Acinetobacter baumannii]MCE6902653.1 hypothetical protein [Acinetobacter baumannii]MCE6910500.1 hypothetical protein [Acinetobacter baumannii]MCE6914496.1 hypothetical protein [Acinetobacter baumannii]